MEITTKILLVVISVERYEKFVAEIPSKNQRTETQKIALLKTTHIPRKVLMFNWIWLCF